MKNNVRKILFGTMLLMGAVILHSCDNNDDDVSFSKVPNEVKSAFESKYPSLQPKEWELKQNHYVADFTQSGINAEAWFNTQGVWQMTETDIPFNQLPQAVIKAFETGKYAQWKVEDVDKIEKPSLEPLYVIEVEQGNTEIDLYYSAAGLLIKEVIDTDDDTHAPNPILPTAITDFIQKNYTGARLANWELETNGFEVDIIHNDIVKEVWFNTSNTWISTSWEVLPANLPQAVRNQLIKLYPTLPIDEADYFETSTDNYYLVELESEPQDIKIKLSPTGEVLTK